jgi:hypothetical protein
MHVIGAETVRIATLADEHPQKIGDEPGSIDAGLSFCDTYSFHSSEGVCLFEISANPAAEHIAPKGVINSIAASGFVTVPEPDNFSRLKPLR